ERPVGRARRRIDQGAADDVACALGIGDQRREGDRVALIERAGARPEGGDGWSIRIGELARAAGVAHAAGGARAAGEAARRIGAANAPAAVLGAVVGTRRADVVLAVGLARQRARAETKRRAGGPVQIGAVTDLVSVDDLVAAGARA